MYFRHSIVRSSNCSAPPTNKFKGTFGFIKSHYKIINLVCGIFLIVVGVLMACGLMTRVIGKLM